MVHVNPYKVKSHERKAPKKKIKKVTKPIIPKAPRGGLTRELKALGIITK